MLHKYRLSEIRTVKNHTPGYGAIAPSPSAVILVDLSDNDIDRTEERV